jgi:SAM-dependent methyltransferase
MSAAAASTARDKGCPAIVVGRGGALPFADGQFDLISAMEVIEHVEDDGALLADIKRVLKPGGLLYVTVPAFQFLWGPADVFAHHYRRYDRGALVRRLQQSGFRPRRVSYFSCLLFPAVAAIRLARRPFVRLDELSAADLKDQFDFYIGPRFLNAPLRAIFGSEEMLLRGLDLPFGSSLLAIAEAA